MKFWPLFVLLCFIIGCSRAPVNPAPADVDKSKPPPAVIPVAQPTPEKKNDTPVKDIAKPRENPEIVRNNERGIIRGIVRREDGANSGIAGAVVWLKPTGKTTLQPPPVETVRLSVEQDEYRPHVLLAQKGGSLELRTVEERSDFQASGAAAFSETIQRGTQRTFPLTTAGLIEVRSQLHPKRSPAYLWVLDGVPGTLTGSDGRFHLPPVSAGEYELVLGHEKQQPARVRLALGANEGAEVRWTLPKP